MTAHSIVSRDEWLAARKALVVKEKQMTRQLDELRTERRRLPWVRIDKPYEFDSPNGRTTLADLFGPRRQLAVYHFMLTPGSDHICPGCWFISDHIDASRQHFEQADLSFCAISRAPLEWILAVKRRMSHVADLHALLQKPFRCKRAEPENHKIGANPMAEHSVFPWWIGYLLASPIRKLLQNPAGILAPYIRDGMTVLEPGPGMGFFTLEIARRVGPSGRVIAVDSQPQMIEGLKRRARKAGLLDRIEARVVPTHSMALEELEGTVDFVFAFAVVHEMPSAGRFFAEAARAMKHGARLLLAEPAGHVREAEFREELEVAALSGVKIVDRRSLKRCITALLQRE